MIRRGFSTIPMLSITLFTTHVAMAGTLNDYNPYNVPIPDNGASVNSDLALSGAPSGAKITKVKVYYEIRHTYPGDLDVWLTAYYGGAWHDYWLYHAGDLGGTDNIIETRDNLHTWDGASPNQTWYLSVRDRASGDVGYIDFFELWVTYEVNEPPSTPSSPDPSNSASNVSRVTDLDWTCSDPNGDTVYYTVYLEKNDSSPDNIIKNDATGSYADPGTLDYGSHYYWQVKADDHKGGVTWGPVWDFYTEAEPSTLRVTVDNISGSAVSNARVHLYYGSGLDATSDGSGVATFTGLSPGTFGYEVYYTGTSWGDEYWGDDSAVVGSGTANDSFTRNMPYVNGSVTFERWNGSTWVSITPGATIDAGTQVRVKVPARNPNSNNLQCAFLVHLDRSQSTGYDYDFSVGLTSVNTGQTVPLTSPGQVIGTSGTYSFAVDYLNTRLGNGTTWRTDATGWSSAFTVAQPPLPVTSGRIVYHSYSGYMASPTTANDGHIFLYDLGTAVVTRLTASLPVENAMNAHFSPNGSLLTFMARPQGSPLPRDRSCLEVYVLDLLTGGLSRLTSNSIPDEDPKFSYPDARDVVFKRDGQIWLMARDGSNPRRISWASADEKSGPNFRPNSSGSHIVFWKNGGASADVWWMNADGTDESCGLGAPSGCPISTPSVQEYYPIFRDADRILFTRWESLTDHNDKIFQYSVPSGGAPTRLSFNAVGMNDSDPFPIGTNYVGFSSDGRAAGKGGWDVYIGDPATGNVYLIAAMNDNLHNLGGWFSPYAQGAVIPDYLVAGRVTTGSPPTGVAGVTLSFSNGLGVLTSDSDGYYAKVVPNAWSGTVTPSKAGYTFSPANRGYSNVTANSSNQDYAATGQTFVIAGHVADSGGTGISGVTINGLPGNPATNSTGDYSASVTYGWSGTATPSKAGYSFNPASRNYSNVTASQASQNYTATVGTFTISGRVTDSGGAAVAGATISGLPGNPATNFSGDYTATVNYGWSGTATPSKAGYSFSPTNRSYSNVTTNQASQNYTATLGTFTISGRITDSSGAAVAGATISGLPGNPATNSSGDYTAMVNYGWSGTATPSKAGYSFSPTNRNYSNVTVNQASQDYTATLGTFAISGRITDSGGAAVAGVTISGLPGNPSTNSSGDYTATVTYGWSGTATPNKAGCSFSPANRSYSNVTGNQVSQNYTATVQTFTVSGRVTDSGGIAVGGVTINGLPGNPVTNGSGDYTAIVSYGWSGMATPSKSGFAFNPAARTYANVVDHHTGQDYLATADSTNPTVAITSPTDGQSFTAWSITVTGAASDPGTPTSGVAAVEVRVNSGPWLLATGTTTWTCDVGLSAGSNAIEARSKDNAGNYSSPNASVTVTANPPPDNTNPTVAIIAPTDGQIVAAASVTLTGSAVDAGSPSSGVALVEVRVNSGAWQSATGTTAWTLDVVVSEGVNAIEARSRDNAGNYSFPTALVNVVYVVPDTVPPTPSPSTWATKPTAAGTTSIHMVAITATDSSGVEYEFECMAGGGHNSGWQDSASYDDTSLQASTTYTYRVRTRDKSPGQNVGDWSTSESATTTSGGGSTTDTDNDGVADGQDACPGTPSGAAVDVHGCAASQRDTDADSVTDDKDQCADTPAGTQVDANGCPVVQVQDADGDGVIDTADLCANTPAGQAVNADGCAQSQLDNDGDGTPNGQDGCPDDVNKTSPGNCGCGQTEAPNCGQPQDFTLRILTTNGATAPAPVVYQAGATPQVYAPEAPAGYHFSHWSGDASGSDNPLAVVMDRDKTITANYAAEPPPPPFTICGFGIVEAMMVSLIGLTLMRAQGRRWV